MYNVQLQQILLNHFPKSIYQLTIQQQDMLIHILMNFWYFSSFRWPILVDAQWSCTEVSICISLKTTEIQHISICLLATWAYIFRIVEVFCLLFDGFPDLLWPYFCFFFSWSLKAICCLLLFVFRFCISISKCYLLCIFSGSFIVTCSSSNHLVRISFIFFPQR